MVHRREVAGEPIVLGNHGALWGNAMTWWDHETGSVWSQPLGAAIAGPLKGTTLELLPSTLTSWADWRKTHPDSLALDAPSSNSGFSLDAMSIVVELGDDSVAFAVPSLRQAAVANSIVGDIPVAVVIENATDNWSVFSRLVDGLVIDLEVTDGQLAEIGGSRRWDLQLGLPLDGGEAGLDLLPGFTSFAADYEVFFPLGAIWQLDGTLVPVR